MEGFSSTQKKCNEYNLKKRKWRRDGTTLCWLLHMKLMSQELQRLRLFSCIKATEVDEPSDLVAHTALLGLQMLLRTDVALN